MTTSRSRSNNMTESYSISSSGAVKRIRTPHPHDVLSGRGGGINSHAGNKTFRDWVRERKEDYNLAGSKAEKAKVANEVIDLVRSQDPPGRFLQRDPSSLSGPSWWVEVDEARALAKTSQALREGAPQIRAAHKDELHERVDRARKAKRKKPSKPSVNNTQTKRQVPTLPSITPLQPFRSNTAPGPPQSRYVSTEKALDSLQKNVQEAKSMAVKDTFSPIVAPLLSNREFEDRFSRPLKKVRVGDENVNRPPAFDPSAETPPLTSTPHFGDIPPLSLEAHHVPKPTNGTAEGLPRSHSLALSDMSMNDFPPDEEFVNPFADESDILNRIGELPKPAHFSPVLRNISSDETGEIYHDTNHYSINNVQAGRNKSSNSSNRSITELSDLPDSTAYSRYETDFGEGMKSVLDAVHPDLTSPDKDDWTPTLLMPWRGGTLSRRSSDHSYRNTLRSGSERQ